MFYTAKGTVQQMLEIWKCHVCFVAKYLVGLLDYGKIIIMIILVNIEISIIKTIIFEFENMIHLLIISQQKKTLCKLELWNFPL